MAPKVKPSDLSARANVMRKQAGRQKRVVDSTAESSKAALLASEHAELEGQNIEFVQVITQLLWEKPQRIARVLKALRRGYFDGVFKNPRIWFHAQYKWLYRLPRQDIIIAVQTCCPEMTTDMIMSWGYKKDKQLPLKLLCIATRSGQRDQWFSRKKETFYEEAKQRYEKFGGNVLHQIVENDVRCVEFSKYGAWKLSPEIPDGVEPKSWCYQNAVLYDRWTIPIPEEFAVRGTWAVENNHDMNLAVVNSGRRKFTLMKFASTELREEINTECCKTVKIEEVPEDDDEDEDDDEEEEDPPEDGDHIDGDDGQKSTVSGISAATPAKRKAVEAPASTEKRRRSGGPGSAAAVKLVVGKGAIVGAAPLAGTTQLTELPAGRPPADPEAAAAEAPVATA